MICLVGTGVDLLYILKNGMVNISYMGLCSGIQEHLRLV
jgi:hypothetical protein